MNEYRLVINLNNSSITTKQVGEDGLFKIRKVDGFRAYPYESKSDVQEYFKKLRADCFNVTNFTKDTFNVIFLSECSNQEIVDAVKAEIQDTSFTVLDSTFSKAFNSDDNNSEDLDEISKKNSALSTEKDALSHKVEELQIDKDRLSNEVAELSSSNNQFLDRVSKLESKLSFSKNLAIEGSLVNFGKNLCWYVFKKEGDLITLVLKQGFSLSEIIKNNKEFYDLENIKEEAYTQTISLKKYKAIKYVKDFLNGEFLNRFSINEIKSMLPFSKNTNELAKILDKDEFRTYLLPTLTKIYFDELSKEIGLTESSNNKGYFMLKNGTYYDVSYKEVREICCVDIELKNHSSSSCDSPLSAVCGSSLLHSPLYHYSSFFRSMRAIDASCHEYGLPAEEIKIHPIIKISLGYKES